MWTWILFPLVTVVVLITLIFELNKLSRMSSEGSREAKIYGKNVVAGIVSGIIVVLIDRGITAAFKNPPSIDYTSFWTILVSGSAAFIVLAFEVGLILLLVVWIINRGLSGLARKKK